MATGYTAKIIEGDGVSFESFVLDCARAFGYLLCMREEPNDAEVPDEFKPDPWYMEDYIKSKKRYDEMLLLTDNEWKEAFGKYREDVLSSYADSCRKQEEQRARYQGMLDKVMYWEPPTPDHIGLKEFMVDQITSSIDSDCYKINPPNIGDINKYIADSLNYAKQSMDTASARFMSEIEKCKERTQWVQALKKSLKEMAE